MYGVSVGVSVRIVNAKSVDFCRPVDNAMENTSAICGCSVKLSEEAGTAKVEWS